MGFFASRGGIYNIKDEKVINITYQPVQSYQTPKDDTYYQWEYTQSGVKIIDAISHFVEGLHAFKHNFVSYGVSAACYMIISTYDNDNERLVPYQKMMSYFG